MGCPLSNEPLPASSRCQQPPFRAQLNLPSLLPASCPTLQPASEFHSNAGDGNQLPCSASSEHTACASSHLFPHPHLQIPHYLALPAPPIATSPDVSSLMALSVHTCHLPDHFSPAHRATCHSSLTARLGGSGSGKPCLVPLIPPLEQAQFQVPSTPIPSSALLFFMSQKLTKVQDPSWSPSDSNSSLNIINAVLDPQGNDVYGNHGRIDITKSYVSTASHQRHNEMIFNGKTLLEDPRPGTVLGISWSPKKALIDELTGWLTVTSPPSPPKQSLGKESIYRKR